MALASVQPRSSEIRGLSPGSRTDLSPAPTPSITLEIRGNYLKTVDVWGKTFIGFWDLDQSPSWCLRSGFNQCCNLLAPVAVFGSGTGQL